MQPKETSQGNLASLSITLLPALAGFFVAFACWTLPAVLGMHIREQLGLTDLQFGLILALPILSGGLVAIVAGLAALRLGARRVMLACLGSLAPVLILLGWVDSFQGYLLVACGLGLAGGTFSAGLQFLSDVAPPRYRGLALSLFGTGMLGAGFNYYMVTMVHEAYSWQAVPMAYLGLLSVVTLLYAMLTEGEQPGPPLVSKRQPASSLALLHDRDSLLLCLLFALTAGSIIAMTVWLPSYISNSFQLPPNHGTHLAIGFILPAALCQALGGWLADRYGATLVLRRALFISLLPTLLLSYPRMSLAIEGSQGPVHLDIALPLGVKIGLIGTLGVTLGMAMGCLLRLLVEMRADRIAPCAGLMLLSGCLAGFLLPMLFALANHWLGVRSVTFMLLFGFAVLCLVALTTYSHRQLRRRFLKGRTDLSLWG